MASIPLRIFVAVSLLAAVTITPHSADAQQQPQGGGQQGGQQQGQPANKDDGKKPDEFAEAMRVLGGPAANPECVWLGRRVVSLLYRDDMDTAFRHLDLYDRFGCPGGHIQATFRCVVRQGPLDPKAPAESVPARVHQCWINPNLQPQTAAAPPSPSTGTSPQ